MFSEDLLYRSIIKARQMKEVARDIPRSPLPISEFDPMAVAVVKPAPVQTEPSIDNEPMFYPPAEHNGARKIARNSDSTSLGYTFFNDGKIYHESLIELRVSTILQSTKDVVELFSQWPKVHFKDDGGIWHYHIFDYLAIMADGERVGIAVKTAKYYNKLMKMFALMAASGQDQIDRAVAWTNEQATRELFANARNINWARDHHDPQEVVFVRDLMRRLPSSIYFWQLYDNAERDWKREAAIFHLIGLGELQAANPAERITEISCLKIVR